MPSLSLFISPVNDEPYTPKFLLTGEAYDMDEQRKEIVLIKLAKRNEQTYN